MRPNKGTDAALEFLNDIDSDFENEAEREIARFVRERRTDIHGDDPVDFGDDDGVGLYD